jgi:serine O-acetyltransferase
MAYTYCNRAAYSAGIDKKKSFNFYLKSIVSCPTWTPAYKGIVRNLIIKPGMNEYLRLLKSDITRYGSRSSLIQIMKLYLVSPGYKYSVVMRTATYIKKTGILFTPLYIVSRLLLRHYEYKFGISIPYNTKIGPGLYIGHYGGIIVNPDAIIGKNCNINHDVTIGAAYGGKSPGVPVIGNNVYFGPGSKVIGGITVGNNVAIGANCVLTKSVPDNAVVAGIPGVVISEKGSYDYVTNTV